MERETIGLSPELIIHPGETIAEAIEDRDMSQHDLAVRTGMTEKHISTVINGQKNISPSFAKKLEYALGISASFWMNLQANYDQEVLAFEELNGISDDELSILHRLDNVTDRYRAFGFISEHGKPVELLLEYRKVLGMSNLLDIPKLSYCAAFRARKNMDCDPYILYAWQRMCELLTNNINTSDQLDVNKLKDRIPDIKSVMFLSNNRINKSLTEIFSECGIAYNTVPYFTGAPVHGFIKKKEHGSVILCVTLRQRYADIFWFSLFHEIAHIINNDTKRQCIDFDSISGINESQADRLARDMLIDPDEYNIFVSGKGYTNVLEIKRFAEKQKVKDFVVLGRLMNDKLIPWQDRLKYDWA